jgi:NAD(P)-dependent dehydrogenase (short-subunit alcohol dehydrogenase family)
MPPKTNILITGANQGIGYEVAKQLLALPNTTNHILLGSRDPTRGAAAAKELDPTGASVTPITLDVTDDTSIADAASHIADKFGHLDVLVNNAGINNELELYRQNKMHPASAELRGLFKSAFDVNVFGAAAVTEAFVPLLEKSEESENTAAPPRLVFVSSHTGSLALADDGGPAAETKFQNPMFPVYRSSKAALNMVMLHYARRFEGRNWKVNASCPNLTATRFSGGVGRKPAVSAENIVRLACLGADGECGSYSDENGGVPW